LEQELNVGIPNVAGLFHNTTNTDNNNNNNNNNNHHVRTSSSNSSKRNSSWTITDLECLTNSPPGAIGSGNGGGGDASSLFQIGSYSCSARSILTPEEQQLWTSMLQLANLSSATLNEVSCSGGGGGGGGGSTVGGGGGDHHHHHHHQMQ